MEWRVLQSDYVLNHRWMKVRRDTCELPKGTVIDDYFWLESPDNTLVVALDPDGTAILTRQYKHAAHRVLLEFPGGVIDPGEDALTGAQRELKEETGYGGGTWTLLGTFFGNPTKASARTYIFLAEDVTAQAMPHWDLTEEIEVVPTPWEKLTSTSFHSTGSALAWALLAQNRPGRDNGEASQVLTRG